MSGKASQKMQDSLGLGSRRELAARYCMSVVLHIFDFEKDSYGRSDYGYCDGVQEKC
jgi:hypothetical protein